MKVIDFSQFSFEKYNVSGVSVIKQKNNWSTYSPESGRLHNGFIFVTVGNCVYRWKGHEENLSPGSVIYLPKGSQHSVTAPVRSLEFFRVNFTVTDIASAEETVFSDSPVLITHSTPQSIFDICFELTSLTLRPRTDFKAMAPLCELVDFCIRELSADTYKGIDIAVNYIADHCIEKIDISDLANMCFMSYSHFFRTFKTKFDMTPIEYKNSLRIKKAKKLLCEHDCSVGEIAEMLGFEGVCYFTRAFKKHVGISPANYRKEKSKK
ncbi:MAG: helix-turn-helix domain-containing protein [Clostridia bacterium]|nr:helix-turn-helix domain-containing protein [Clostridia bacterium]